jgi:GNAT superfamily N-acetyltransferase
VGDPLDIDIRAAALEDASVMGLVWWRAAMLGYEGIFPPEAPPMPPPEEVAQEWRRAILSLHTGGTVLVACLWDPDRTIVGTVAAVPDPEDPSRGHLRALYVDPGHWGRGVGRALHDHAIAHFQAMGFQVAILWVLEGNVRARAMWERWGWQPGPVRPTDYPGINEICYAINL